MFDARGPNVTIQHSLLLLCCCCLSLKVTKSPDPIRAPPTDGASKPLRGVTSNHCAFCFPPSSLLQRVRLAILTLAPCAVCACRFPELILHLSAAFFFPFFSHQALRCVVITVCACTFWLRPSAPVKALRLRWRQAVRTWGCF